MKMRTAFAVGLTLFALSMPASGHHSLGKSYDMTRPFVLAGTITTIQLRNPHCYFHLDVKDPATGVIQNWVVESANGNWIVGQAAKEMPMFAALKVGMVVSVNGFRAQGISYRAAFETLTDDQGKVLASIP